MNDYTGKICPYCKTEFNPGDDIVVCSECDMPHHKDCWVENQGCTTFGCLGAIKSADETASSVTATQMNFDDYRSPAMPVNSGVVFCTQCGTQNANTASFCSRCGNRLATVPQGTTQPPGYTQGYTASANPHSYMGRQNSLYQQHNSYQAGCQSAVYNTYQPYQTQCIDPDVQQLIGTKAEYYIPQFQTLKSEGKSSSWNWSAFLVTPYWMMYRKMYGYAVVILVADIIISLMGSMLLSVLALVGYSIFGVLGNSIYMKHVEDKANQAKGMNEPYKSQFLAYNSGVNDVAVVLALIGRAICVGILLA